MTRITTIFAAVAALALPSALSGQDAASVAEGAVVWANNCVRCHNARPSSERTDAQWTVVVNHMRARANLTRTQASVTAAFLQATNLPEGDAMAAPIPAPAVVNPAADDEILPDEILLTTQAALRTGALVSLEGIDPEALDRLFAYLTALRQR